jgi:hypothetical protein
LIGVTAALGKQIPINSIAFLASLSDLLAEFVNHASHFRYLLLCLAKCALGLHLHFAEFPMHLFMRRSALLAGLAVRLTVLLSHHLREAFRLFVKSRGAQVFYGLLDVLHPLITAPFSVTRLVGGVLVAVADFPIFVWLVPITTLLSGLADAPLKLIGFLVFSGFAKLLDPTLRRLEFIASVIAIECFSAKAFYLLLDRIRLVVAPSLIGGALLRFEFLDAGFLIASFLPVQSGDYCYGGE